jgi:hypothetical protein
MIHFSFRRYSEKTLRTIVEVVADNENVKNGAGLGFRKLKGKTEQALNQTLHPVTFRNYLNILVHVKILVERKGPARGSKAEFRLTEKARQEHKAGVLGIQINSVKSAMGKDVFVDEKERYRLCKLLFAINTLDNRIYELPDTEQGILETTSRLTCTEVAVKDLVPMRVMIEEFNNCVVTYYEPISCILLIKKFFFNNSNRIWSREEAVSRGLSNVVNIASTASSTSTSDAATRHHNPQDSSESRNMDKNDDKKSIVFYNLMVMGFSISDILARRHKGPSPIPSYELTKFSILHDDMTRAKIEKGVRLLVNEAKILKRIGRLRGETRYDFADDSLRLIVGNCLAVFGHTIEALSKVWNYERKVNSKERAWLERIYVQRQADRIISDYSDSLKSISEAGTIDWQAHEDTKKFWYKFILKEVHEIKERCYYRSAYRDNENEGNSDQKSLMDLYPFPLQQMVEDMICPSFLEESLGIEKAKRASFRSPH